MGIKIILEKELVAISLSQKEVLDLQRIAKEFIKQLASKKIKAYVGGSLAKGTVIKKPGKQDIDIFVVFDSNEGIRRFEKVLKMIKLPGQLKKVHGSRDYFQIICENILLELVPVMKNKNPELAENVTDVSLSHVKYIGEIVKKNPKISDEIKLAKAFCWANRCYGAEGYVRGFSGYSLEVLVIYFGSFVKFLKGISRKRVIDPLKYFKNEREVLNELNTSKLTGPVILIDPTYRYRNVTAGLGEETFEKFNIVAKKFLKSPSLNFFEWQSIDIRGLKRFADKKKVTFLEINLKTNRQEGDIAGTKMKKFLDFFVSELGRRQQKVLVKEFDYLGEGDKAKGYVVVEEKKEIEIRGPSVGLVNIVKNFRKANGKNSFKKNGYWWVKKETSIQDIFRLVKKVEKEMGISARLNNF
ncbi:MAG: nucleotidyltransferase domain-containing protein [archaeon]